MAAVQWILMGEVLNYLENIYLSHEAVGIEKFVIMNSYHFYNYKNSSEPNFLIPELRAMGTCFPSNLVPLPFKYIDRLPRKLAFQLIFLK